MISRIAIIPVILFVGISAMIFHLDGWVAGLIGLVLGVVCVALDGVLARRKSQARKEGRPG